ncbi:uncharacterized protein LOC143289285 [Babylonia areolata]|uniref:uncharacterized protein LOC143289285 n=1 Tax=Babylonia areolata TaxID=304850 RepID=UPI003FD15917
MQGSGAGTGTSGAECKPQQQQSLFHALLLTSPNKSTFHTAPTSLGLSIFLTPRKVGIFGVCCEGLPQQINYLIDEGASSSKGSNAVVSYLHHFFNNYGVGEQHCDLHCDNCSGQNKNRFVLWYCAWRVLMGKHSSIGLHFMPPGHTKFAPDWCFGLLKRAFRRAEVHCLQDLCDVVQDSTPVKHNRAQVVKGEAQDARTQVDVFDWQQFSGHHFRKLPGIKKIGHFRFSSDRPGCMMYRETLADQETVFPLVDEDKVATVLRELPNEPAIIPPPGLSLERQNYLYKNIRSFVREDAKDFLTPEPRY